VIGEKQVEVNSQPATLDQPPYVKQGRTLVPLRFISEALGAQVTWDGVTKQATIKLAGPTLTVTVGSKVAYMDKEMTTLDVPAEITGGRTFVPLRFVSEAFGAYVDYDNTDKSIFVRYNDETSWQLVTAPKANMAYTYPPDWKAEVGEDGYSITFTGPDNSTLFVECVRESPSEMNALIKKSQEERGWKLENEQLYSPSNLNEGFKLDYSIYDYSRRTTMWEIYYIDPNGTGSFMVDQLVADENVAKDCTIMIDIAY
jgi:hypothetical protein